MTFRIVIFTNEKQNNFFILCYSNTIMIKVLKKIKKIDGFILGTFGALFLTIAMILFFVVTQYK